MPLRSLLLSLTVGLITTISAAVIAAAHEICGDPPPAQFRVRNDETLKGEIEGKAQLLTKFVGDAQLGGKVETSQKEIFAKYPDADRARTDTYFAYMFCVLLFSPDNPQSFEEKQRALTTFYEHLRQKTEPVSLPIIPDADSGWIDGGSDPHKFCDPQLKAIQAKYPSLNITMTVLPEQHRSEYTPFKHDLYRYTCSFSASLKK